MFGPAWNQLRGWHGSVERTRRILYEVLMFKPGEASVPQVPWVTLVDKSVNDTIGWNLSSMHATDGPTVARGG